MWGDNVGSVRGVRVCIVGGGIGGLATAIALQQRGVEAQVYEAAPELTAVGKGIWMPPNALAVLDQLGVGEDVASRGVELDQVELRDRDSGVIQALPMHWVRDRFGRNTVSILRSELQAALVDRLAPGTLHLGKRYRGSEDGGDRVVVEFEDSTATEAGLLIGADGLRSAVRSSVDPGARLRSSGQVCSLALCDFELPRDSRGRAFEVWGGRFRIGFSAVSDRRVYWFAPRLATGASGAVVEPLTPAERWEGYRGFPSPIPELLQATDPDEILDVELVELVALSRWWSGRRVLVGDAAHAMTPNTGQGGAQALEDAACLAQCLVAHDDLRVALTRYEKLRRPKATRLSSSARRLGRLAHLQNRTLRRLRNATLRAIPQTLVRHQMGQIYSLQF